MMNYFDIQIWILRLRLFDCGHAIANFNHIVHGYFTGAATVARLPQYEWSNHENTGDWIIQEVHEGLIVYSRQNKQQNRVFY